MLYARRDLVLRQERTGRGGREGGDAAIAREVPQTIGVTGNAVRACHRPVVARDLALEVDPTADEPDRRIEPIHALDETLEEIRPIVVAAKVRVFVHRDLVERRTVERVDEVGREEDRGRTEA